MARRMEGDQKCVMSASLLSEMEALCLSLNGLDENET